MGSKQDAKTESAKKRTKGISLLLLWGNVIFLVAAIAVSIFFFYQKLKVELFTEKQMNLTEITVKVSEVVDAVVDSMQGKADSAGILIEGLEMPEEERLFEELEHMTRILDLTENTLLAIDSNGRFYNSEGPVGRWEIRGDLSEDQSGPVIRDLMFSGRKNTCMVFFSRLSRSAPLGEDGTVITHVAVTIPIDTMRELFSISVFGNRCSTYLINRDGRRIYKLNFTEEFVEGYNILSALEKDRLLMGGTAGDLSRAIDEQEYLCMEFENPTNEERYFLSTVPMNDTEWTILLFVPTAALSGNTNHLMRAMMVFFSIIAGTIILMSVCLIFVVTRDQNDRKLIAQQKESNRLLARAADEAKSANAAKTEFLSHMSHDIRTPINGIMGMTNIALKNTEDSARVLDCLLKINGAAEHLLSLINDVLDMSRIESGKVIIAHIPLDICTLADNCASIIGGQLLSRQVEFKREFGEFEHPFLLGDELHLRQVLINILGNAVKFTPDGGTITFRVQEFPVSDTRVSYRFEVEDNGVGMSEAFQEKIFEAFSQEDGGNRTTYKGTGLGMTITKQFVDLMGGTIQVRSQLDQGSCFIVEIPFDINPEQKRETAAHSDTVVLAGMRILLVEDNELNLEIAQEILEDENMTVTTAENGQIAVETFTGAAAGTFDAILMDIMMPVMNGLEATRAIRSSDHPEAKTIPIIAMTANAYSEDIRTALDAGMNAHLAKPIDFDRLFSVLSQYKK